MEYRKLGNTDLEVSTIGLGCWAMGGEVPVWGPVDDNESIAAIQQGLDLGITLVDTAPAYGYGHSEEVVGKAIAGRRDRVVVATKCGLVWKEPGGRLDRSLASKSVAAECAASLRRLRVETIDLYQIHWPDPAVPIHSTMEFLARLRDEGKIRAIGVSNFSCEQMTEARKYGPVECLQTELSIFEPEATDELLPYCREYGVGAIAYGPLARGLLTGKFSRSSRFKDIRSRDLRFNGPAFERNLAAIERLKGIAARLGCSMTQLALGWVLSQDGVTAAIAGVKRPSQVVENVGAAGIRLPHETLDEIHGILTRRE
jgi:aryl-alcohol dehydrogenase-like predicted oxidoreductase